MELAHENYNAHETVAARTLSWNYVNPHSTLTLLFFSLPPEHWRWNWNSHVNLLFLHSTLTLLFFSFSLVSSLSVCFVSLLLITFSSLVAFILVLLSFSFSKSLFHFAVPFFLLALAGVCVSCVGLTPRKVLSLPLALCSLLCDRVTELLQGILEHVVFDES